MGRAWRAAGTVAILLGLIVLTPAPATRAAGVVGTGSPASCTEAALNAALAGGGLVTFSCGPNPVTIGITTEKVINVNTRIDGGGLITLDGQNATRILFVELAVTLELWNITLINADVGNDDGGAIFSRAGVVNLLNSALNDNRSRSGGAIFNNSGVLVITDSTLSNNRAGTDGGAIFNNGGGVVTVTSSTLDGNRALTEDGGAVSNLGTLNVSNSTLSNNQSPLGGAVYTLAAPVTITSSTLHGNSANQGGGIYNDLGTVNLSSTIVANSPIGGNCGGNAVTSQGNNLSNDGTCSLTQPGDRPNTGPVLGPLADNGGATMTHMLLPGSPAMDGALGCAIAADQRGVGRPQGDACDIGAVEVRQSTFTLCVSISTGLITSPPQGGCGAGQIDVSAHSVSFCINTWTGQISHSFGQPCAPPRIQHSMPDDGDLLTCVHIFTGAHRWVWNHSQCTAGEIPNTIPASP